MASWNNEEKFATELSVKVLREAGVDCGDEDDDNTIDVIAIISRVGYSDSGRMTGDPYHCYPAEYEDERTVIDIGGCCVKGKFTSFPKASVEILRECVQKEVDDADLDDPS